MEKLIKHANGQWDLQGSADLNKNVNMSYQNDMNTVQKDSADPKWAPKEVKVKQLKAQIDAGTYKPDPKKIADKMLSKEELRCSENGQWNIIEKVNQPDLSSLDSTPAAHIKPKKYQGGDPRHANDVMGSTHYRGSKNKQGDIRPEVDNRGNKLTGATSGTSIKKEEQ